MLRGFAPQDLPAAIEKVINRPEMARSRWGIEIQTLSGKSLYSINADKFFTPASAAKPTSFCCWFTRIRRRLSH